MIWVKCLESNVSYGFTAKTPYEALQKMKYTLDWKRKDSKCVINKTLSGRTLWFEHSGKTYSVLNNRL